MIILVVSENILILLLHIYITMLIYANFLLCYHKLYLTQLQDSWKPLHTAPNLKALSIHKALPLPGSASVLKKNRDQGERHQDEKGGGALDWTSTPRHRSLAKGMTIEDTATSCSVVQELNLFHVVFRTNAKHSPNTHNALSWVVPWKRTQSNVISRQGVREASRTWITK